MLGQSVGHHAHGQIHGVLRGLPLAARAAVAFRGGDQPGSPDERIGLGTEKADFQLDDHLRGDGHVVQALDRIRGAVLAHVQSHTALGLLSVHPDHPAPAGQFIPQAASEHGFQPCFSGRIGDLA